MHDLPITIDDLYLLERKMHTASDRLNEYLAAPRHARNLDVVRSLWDRQQQAAKAWDKARAA